MADPVSLSIQAALMAANMAMTASQKIEGPRLTDLSVTTADYGAALNYFHGIRRFDGVSCIWAEPLREVKRRNKTKGGKFNEYTYYGTWAVVVADHEVDAYTRILFDRNLVYDATGAGPLSPFSALGDITQFMTFYLGTEDQEPDPRMAATIDAEFGDGSTPAYRGVSYIVFKDVPLEKLGNRLPQVTVEAVTLGGTAYPLDVREAAGTTFYNGWGFTFSPDGTRAMWAQDFGSGGDYEIWDVQARAPMVSGNIPDMSFNQPVVGIEAGGPIWVVSGGNLELTRLSADGLTAIGAFALGSLCEYCMVLKDKTDLDPPELRNEYVLAASSSIINDGYMMAVGGTVPTLLDTSAATGLNWQIKFFLRDTYGDIWALGGGGDLDQFTLALWRIVDTGVRPGPDFGFVTLPSSTGGVEAFTAGFHYRDEALGLDQINVIWGTPGIILASIDIATMTLIDSVSNGTTADWKQMMHLVQPGAATFWLAYSEYSSADLSLIRTITPASWDAGYGLGVSATFYDRLNHALMRPIVGDNTLAWLYLDRVSGDGVTLQSIVEDIAERCGLEPGDFDASDLDQIVTGYSWSQGTGKAILEPLLEIYDSEARPHDFQIEFLRRGGSVGAAIPVADMGVGGSVRYTVPTLGDTDLPLKVNLTFADVDSDQQPNTALAQRPGAATDSRRELSLDGSTWASDPTEARQKADGYLRRTWIKAQTYENALTRAYSALEPGDARSLVLDDVTVSAKVSRLEFGANGVLTLEWERYAPSVHVATSLPGADADGLVPAELTTFGYTKGLVLDIPLATDADEGLITYLAAAPYSPDVPWPGAIFYRSTDSGVTFDDQLGTVASNQAATMGYAMSALPDALATCWDLASAVTVQMFDGELTSATKAQVANGANRAVLGDEIIGFTTATLVAAHTYQLSGFIRGRRGTEWATGDHATGEPFVLLSGLPRAIMGASDVGDPLYVRPTTNGGPNCFAQTLDPFSGASLKPYSPAHLAVEDVAGDLVATWVRRTRIGGEAVNGTTPPLGEGSEAYVMQVLNGAGAVIRTYSGLSSPTATYLAADIATDSGAGETLRVMQVSATVNNGFPADIAI